jgi:hypothetical protein
MSEFELNELIEIPKDDITMFNVYPNFSITKRIVKAKIGVMEYIPFTSAKISVLLYDDSCMNCVVDSRIYLLDGVDFLQWGTDDKFLINWVKSKLC